MNRHLQQIIPQLARRHILVLGDVLLDEYVTGRAQRMSREAPIPVLEFESRRYIPGGAANPASNIVALGSTALQLGIIGDDETGRQLCHTLEARGITTDSLIIVAEKPTTLKTRILAQMGLRFPQQVARIDTLSREPITSAIETQIIERIQAVIASVDAILCSDYHNGLLTLSLIQQVRHLANAAQKPLFADAQGNLQKYHGFDVVKCNADDAEAYLHYSIQGDSGFAKAARALQGTLQLKSAMVITRGAAGATIAHAGGQVEHCPAPDVSDVYDTVGAGDTSIAVLTLARVAGASYRDAMMLANYASGIVVRHVGNYTPTPDELLSVLSGHSPS